MTTQNTLIVSVLAAVVIGAFVGGGGMDYVASIGADKDTGPEENRTAPDEAKEGYYLVNEAGVDGTVTLPEQVSSAKVYKFEPGVEVQKYGDHDDFNIGDATSGLELGDDYEVATISNAKEATFSDVKHHADGNYTFVLVDNSDPREYHYAFWKEGMDKYIRTGYWDKGKAKSLDNTADFDEWATYGTETIGYSFENSEYFYKGSDLSFDSNGTKTLTLEKTVSVSEGVAYLGSLSVTSFNDGEGIENVDVAADIDGENVYSKNLKDGSTGPLSDSTSFTNALTTRDVDLSMQPEEAVSTITIKLTVTGEFDTDESAAGDGQIGPGETIASVNGFDIFDNAIGDGSAVSFQGNSGVDDGINVGGGPGGS